MPIIDSIVEDLDNKLNSQIATWIIKYGRGGVAYQEVGKGYFFYRIPTIGQLLDLEIAEAYNPLTATLEFLDSIKLSALPKVKISVVQDLLFRIVTEHFPKSEENLAKDILKYTYTHMHTLIGAMDAHIKEISTDNNTRGMTYNEVLELLAIKQLITQRPIMNGSMPAKNRGGKNAKKERLDRIRAAGITGGGEEQDQ